MDAPKRQQQSAAAPSAVRS
uniref:Uncharacterized protein n=1 Tax=Anopheles minimus TaxID=112268 RepID=A0A182WPL1_9DIPT